MNIRRPLKWHVWLVVLVAPVYSTRSSLQWDVNVNLDREVGPARRSELPRVVVKHGLWDIRVPVLDVLERSSIGKLCDVPGLGGLVWLRLDVGRNVLLVKSSGHEALWTEVLCARPRTWEALRAES